MCVKWSFILLPQTVISTGTANKYDVLRMRTTSTLRAITPIDYFQITQIIYVVGKYFISFLLAYSSLDHF